jgi:16S rRNA processing protein RimM
VLLVVGVLGRAHGVRGEIALDVRSDRVEERLSAGSVLLSDPADVGPLEVTGFRRTANKTLVRFDGVTSREQAEELRGVKLLVEAESLDEPDAWYPHELRGLRVQLVDGTPVGTVKDLLTLPAQDVLEIDRPGAAPALVPLLRQFVPSVDVAGGLVVIDPPPGLLE